MRKSSLPKTILAFLASAILFLIGCIALFKSGVAKPDSHIFYDTAPYCDHGDYLAMGHSYEFAATLDNIKEARRKALKNLSNDLDHKSFAAIKPGDSLFSILKKRGVSSQEIYALSKALKPFVEARDIKEGDRYRFELEKIAKKRSSVALFEIKKSDQNRVPYLYTAKKLPHKNNTIKFSVVSKKAPINVETEFETVKVSGTLYASFQRLPFGNELMQRLMETFYWTMRLPEEVMRNDTILMKVEKKYALGDFIGYGQIESAIYRKADRSFFATYFASSDGQVSGYFDEHGKSLEAEFLYSPVAETTATSDQNWRFHPVRKRRIRHNGIDYRGTIGTDFFALADGQVVEKRFNKNVGNMMRIKHKYGIYTEYFHADSLANNLSVGSEVQRGQFIGKIGQTGRLCTGPHLHMGLYKMAGKRRSYITMKSLRSKLEMEANISQAYMDEFLGHKKSVMAFFDKNSSSPDKVAATTR